MKVNLILWLVISILTCAEALAGDTCYGYKSTTQHFECTPVGNCTWWAAYKRPDLAAKIGDTSGWNGGQWYNKLKGLGFSEGDELGSTLKPGSIVDFTLANGGHVAYIEKTYSDGSFDVSEMDSTGSFGSGGIYYATYYPNGDGTFSRNHGSTRFTLKGFIYPRKTCDTTAEQCRISVNMINHIGWFPSVTDCQQASQWYLVNDQKQIIGSTTKSHCPTLMCSANY